MPRVSVKVKKQNKKQAQKQTHKTQKTRKTHKISQAPKARKKRSTSTLGTLFHFPSIGQPKKNFSTSFEYGNFHIDAKSKGGDVTINFKLSNKNLNFNGIITLNEKNFSQLQKAAEHILSNLNRIS